jgi:simple sugar transport system ATP-binding protein
VDVGSIEFIHKRIVAARDQGMGVLLISAELDEILALSDRVAVMFKGKIIETLPISEVSRDRMGLLMAGVKE